MSIAAARSLDADLRLVDTDTMGHGTLAFVGRGSVLEELRGAVALALAGRGGVWLLCGEPGIGKSRLAEEIGRAVDGATVVWGRCWEAGGAPAYWPWIQILRALVRRPEIRRLAEDGGRAELLGQLLPELGARARSAEPALSPEQARFELMDAVGGLLCEAAQHAPMLLVLDDLHAADESSLVLLDFLARQLHAVPLAIVGTFREAEAQRAPALQRVAQEAHTVALGRLDRAEVATFLERALGAAPGPGVVETVYQRTEGNPLFLVELARLLITHGVAAGALAERALVVPGTLRTAIRERVDALSPAARAALELGSALGRELSVPLLCDAFGDLAEGIGAALEEAAAAALVVPIGREAYRFTHILVREVVHDDLPSDRRCDLHFRLADALRRAPVPDADRPWSEIAHHFFAAGSRGLGPAIEATERAAQRYLDQLAFSEAIAACQRGLEVLATAPGAPAVRRAELLLGLGHAQLRAGHIEHGRATCRAAAALARDLGDADLFARAALELGAVYHFGHVDDSLVELLREALERLDASDSSLRARTLARLAAALQPAADPSGPIELAREAIAMARRIGDEDTLLAALRAGCSSMVDLVDPRQRLDLDREHVALAERRGDRVDALRGHMRLAFDLFELHDLAGACRTLARVRDLAEELGHPYYRWRVRAVDALVALWDGRLDDAEAAIADAEELASSGGDPNARGTLFYQRMQLGRLRGASEELVELMPRLDGIYGSSTIGLALAEVTGCACLHAAGRTAEALRRLVPETVDMVVAVGDRTVLLQLAELAAGAGDRRLAEALAERVEAARGQLVSGGVIGMVWYGPMERAAALVAQTLGRNDEALRHFEAALEDARSLGADPLIAQGAAELGAALLPRDPDRARRLLDEARALAAARGLSLPGLTLTALPAAGDGVATTPSPEPTSRARAAFAMHPEGDTWRIDYDGDSFHIKDLRGLHLLAELVAHPGRESHVLDLASPSRGEQPVDTGDGGEVLDERARLEYRSRAAELEAELAEAEAWNDPVRGERARAELEFLQRELARAVGLGGRARRTGAAAERARVNVQRRLRDAIRRIGEHHPALGRHLERSVRTGTFCSYEPE